MDRQTFQKNYNLSRGQMDRLLAKAWQNNGRFELAECGAFKATKTGTGVTAPVDIVPVRQRSQSAPIGPVDPVVTIDDGLLTLPSSLFIPKDMANLSKSELERLLVAANVLKVRQSTESEKQRIRDEVVSEMITVVAACFSDLRIALDDLRLPGEQLDRLRSALYDGLKKIEEIKP